VYTAEYSLISQIMSNKPHGERQRRSKRNILALRYSNRKEVFSALSVKLVVLQVTTITCIKNSIAGHESIGAIGSFLNTMTFSRKCISSQQKQLNIAHSSQQKQTNQDPAASD